MKDSLSVRPSKLIDVILLKSTMRQEHVDEVWASDHFTPEQALGFSYLGSLKSYTIFLNNDIPVFMFGVVDNQNEAGVIWALGSNAVDRYPKQFSKITKEYLQILMDSFPVLYNYVDSRYKKGVRYLEYLGAHVYEAKPYGRDEINFHYFEFRRD